MKRLEEGYRLSWVLEVFARPALSGSLHVGSAENSESDFILPRQKFDHGEGAAHHRRTRKMLLEMEQQLLVSPSIVVINSYLLHFERGIIRGKVFPKMDCVQSSS